MTWSPKVILTANFYGSYLHAEDFDDTVIIPDGNIDQLISAAEERVKIYAKLTNGEAELYVFCLLGLTDMVEKLTVGTQYVLKPIQDAVPQLERKMSKAVSQLQRYGAKIIWSTTYPISLAKYHKSQGWNIDSMAQFGLSRGMGMEQIQLYNMTERFMDVCHTFNKRIGLEDLFFIRKVYYSRAGQRELLTHNLLEDGINPSTSVTAEWNIELSKYLMQIRQRKSAVPSLLDQNLGRSNHGGSDNSYSSGATLFTYGSDAGLLKRTMDRDYNSYPKRSKVEESFGSKLGTQSEDAQKKLAMGMLKFISDNLGEDALKPKSGQYNSSLDNQASAQGARWENRRYPGNANPGSSGFQHSSNPSFGFVTGNMGPSSNRPNAQFRFGNPNSVPGLGGNSVNNSSMGSGYGGLRAVGFTGYGSSGQQGPSSYNNAANRKQFGSGAYSTQGKGVQSSDAYHSRTITQRKQGRLGPKTHATSQPTGTLSNFQKKKAENKKVESVATAAALQDTKPKDSAVTVVKQPDTQHKSVSTKLTEGTSKLDPKHIVELVKPKTVKERLHIKKPSQVDALSRDSTGIRKPKNQSVIVPLMANRTAVIRKGANFEPNGSTNMQASDEFLLNTAGTPKKPPLLVEPRPSSMQRNVDLRYAGPSAPNSLMNTPVGPHPDSSPSPGFCDVRGMSIGIPNLLRTLKTGDEPSFKTDTHGKRSDYILMAMKPSHNNVKIRRIIADYNDHENDKLHQIKIGSTRFAAFDRKQDLGDRDILPSVSFLKTNQWNPGYEKVSAPMTILQKEVAAFNTALYQLMKNRRGLISKLGKHKDPTIRLCKTRCFSEHEKLCNIMIKSTTQQKQDVPSDMKDTSVEEGHAEKSNDDVVVVSEYVNEEAEVDDAKVDDWTDLEEPDIIEFVADDRGEKIESTQVDEKGAVTEQVRVGVDESVEVNQRVDDSEEGADTVVQCFDIPKGVPSEVKSVETNNSNAELDNSSLETVEVKTTKRSLVEVIDLDPPVETINLESDETSDQASMEVDPSHTIDASEPMDVKQEFLSEDRTADAVIEPTISGDSDALTKGALPSVETTNLESADEDNQTLKKAEPFDDVVSPTVIHKSISEDPKPELLSTGDDDAPVAEAVPSVETVNLDSVAVADQASMETELSGNVDASESVPVKNDSLLENNKAGIAPKSATTGGDGVSVEVAVPSMEIANMKSVEKAYEAPIEAEPSDDIGIRETSAIKNDAKENKADTVPKSTTFGDVASVKQAVPSVEIVNLESADEDDHAPKEAELADNADIPQSLAVKKEALSENKKAEEMPVLSSTQTSPSKSRAKEKTPVKATRMTRSRATKSSK